MQVPYLWVLEDLHWADAETLSFLTLLRPRLTECRLLLLLTARSAELRTNTLAWETLQALDRTTPLQRHTLTRLDADAIAQLVRQLLSEDSPTLTDSLARESAGVPLYIVETLMAWRDEAYLLPDERGGWRWREGLPAATPPHLGETVIGHRLSRLSPPAEEVLTAAAVMGPEAGFDLLASVCALPGSVPNVAGPDGYLLATDDLLRLGFLAETDTGYRFSHEQVRRAVYYRLSPKQRQRLHGRVAQALETLSPEKFETLAHHFVAAGEREPAIEYLTRAAERSREHFAHQATLALYERLLDLLTQPEDRPARFDTLSERADVLGWIGDREAEGRDLEEMLDLARAPSDDVRWATALLRRSEWQRVRGEYQLANEDATAALDIYSRLGDDLDRANALTQLGQNLRYAGDWRQGKTYFEEALPIHEAVGDLEGQIRCLMGMVSIAQCEGDPSLQLAYSERGLALARATGSPYWISYMLSAVGLVYIALGDVDAAEPHLREAFDLTEASGDRRRQAITRIRLAYVAGERGDIRAAETQARAALATFRDVQDAFREGQALDTLGCAALLRDDPATARELIETAIQTYEEIGAHLCAVADLPDLALAELALGDEDAAWRHSCEAVAKVKAEWPETEILPMVYYYHYRVAEGTRRWAAARVALEDAVSLVNKQAEMISDPAWREKFRTGGRINRGIAVACVDLPPPGQLRVSLARIGTSAHRRPAPEEAVTVIWTLDAGEPDAALAEREGKVALRRHRILRLLAEAEEAGGSPAVADLAGALDVSSRTIDSDLAALRGQGHPVHTHGCRA